MQKRKGGSDLAKCGSDLAGPLLNTLVWRVEKRVSQVAKSSQIEKIVNSSNDKFLPM